MLRILGLVVGAFLLVATSAAAQTATIAGAVTTPHPTLRNLSIEWAISGDSNENGVVTVRFREAGGGAWRVGHPLFRVPAGNNQGFSWRNRHAGSIFDLAPDTTYEIELTLQDPDGGNQTATVQATTRPSPTVPSGSQTVSVTPSTISAAIGSASPGDVLVLAPGTYRGIEVGRSGAAGSPLVLRGGDRDEVVVEGDVRMDGQQHVWIADLTVRGQIKFNNSANIVVQGCRVEAQRDGIVAYGAGTSDGYFSDNVVIGPTVWRESAIGASGDNLGEGIVMTGPGNVIEHNQVEGFRDCISLLEDNAVNQVSIDIVGNDLFKCADDAIEADFSMGNVRVIRNRSASAFIAWSSQPSLGGPTYFIRNVAFATAYQAFKPQRNSVGDVLYHNTVVKQGDALNVFTSDIWSRATMRNNIFIGGPEAQRVNGYSNGQGRIMSVPSLDVATSSLDYNGYGSFELERFDGQFGGTSFSNFDAFRANTTETHAVKLDLSVFQEGFSFPRTMFPAVTAPDLRLRAGQAAVDSGTSIPNINDSFSGSAPDLGAYEQGASLAFYGPRRRASLSGCGVLGAGATSGSQSWVWALMLALLLRRRATPRAA